MTQPANPQPADRPKFDPNAAHMNKPRLRPIRGFPAEAQTPDGSQKFQMLGLADAKQISQKMVMTMPASQLILPLMDGSRDLDQIVTQVGKGLTRPIVEALVAQLDDAALIYGPTFDALIAQMKKDFDSSEILPPATTGQLADAIAAEGVQKGDLAESASLEEKDAFAAGKLREAMDQWMAEALKQAPDPAFDALPKAVVAPHLDYQRGWINYGAIYGRMRVVDRPDRIVILGTNHFGDATGVCGCNKGYSTMFGVCNADKALIAELERAVGPKLFENRFDHEREHSIELHIPWIQHVFGKDASGNYPQVFGALIHDPAPKNGESYDGQGVALETFTNALRAAIAKLPGKTLIVSSADLSHIGPAFGDQQNVSAQDEAGEQLRQKVFAHDREMINHVLAGKASDLIGAMAWQQNPTRWCSTGNICAALMVTQPSSVKLLNYSAAMDQQGMAMVSSAAIVMN